MSQRRSLRASLLLTLASGVLGACSVLGAQASRVPTPRDGWWQTSDTTACATRGVLWTRTGVSSIGSCAGIVPASPPSYEVAIGDEIAIHAWFDDTLAGPDFAGPASSDPSILRVVSVADGGGTTVYSAVGPGTAALSTQTFCADVDGHGSTLRQCVIATVTVTQAR